MLGQCCIAELLRGASKALVNAIDNNASREEFVQVILGLVKAEVGRGNYVAALNVLENVPLERLSQEDSVPCCGRPQLPPRNDLAETAITLLRRIELLLIPLSGHN